MPTYPTTTMKPAAHYRIFSASEYAEITADTGLWLADAIETSGIAYPELALCRVVGTEVWFKIPESTFRRALAQVWQRAAAA
jgi:hypothetical protein